MTYDFIYESDYKRLIQAVINDSWDIIPQTKGQIGSVVQAYSNSQLNLITANCIVYKIESNNGNIVGFVVLQVNSNVASILISQFRPAFVQFSTVLYQLINTFVQKNFWQDDILL